MTHINRHIQNTPSIKSGIYLSEQLFYDNALAVFGIVPMFALCCMCENENMLDKMHYIKSALERFKYSPEFRERVSKNLGVLNGNTPVMLNDINVFDVTLRELGYYEQYNQLKLESEVKELINFLNCNR